MSELPRFQESVQTLEAFRGIGRMKAMQLICEIGDFRRFERPTALMAYLSGNIQKVTIYISTRRGTFNSIPEAQSVPKYYLIPAPYPSFTVSEWKWPYAERYPHMDS